jgi:excisionase family DNA binding protein
MPRPGRPRTATPANIDSATVAEVAGLLACSDRHVQRLVERGELEAYRTGRSVRIWLRSVLAHQEAGRITPA